MFHILCKELLAGEAALFRVGRRHRAILDASGGRGHRVWPCEARGAGATGSGHPAVLAQTPVRLGRPGQTDRDAGARGPHVWTAAGRRGRAAGVLLQ